MLTLNPLVPFPQCYLFSKTLTDRVKAADTHLAHLSEVARHVHALFPQWTVVSSLGIYCESLVFGVHLAPMSCNF